MSTVRHRGTFVFCFLALVVFAAAQNAPRPELTARELFYNATATSSPAAKSPAAKAQPKQATAKKTAPAAPVTQQANGSSQTPQSSQPSHPEAQIVNASDAVPMRTSAPAPANGIALGLKYTVLKLAGSAMNPVAPNSVFHANDKIQFSVETNAPGYLYIVAQGSSEKWMPLFPSAEIADGNNSVEGFHTYTFPQGYRFGFDEQTGDERVFIILSRETKPDFEQLVYSLQGKKTAPTSAPQPAQPAGPVLRASIDNSAVDHLHQTYARDLVIERIGDEGTAPRADTQEKAVYVVNPTGSADSVVVAEIHLVHQ
jgi:Domain of unknown function (DUF4384)